MKSLRLTLAASFAAALLAAPAAFAGSSPGHALIDKGIYSGHFDIDQVAFDAFVIGHITGNPNLLKAASALDDTYAITGGFGLKEGALHIDQVADGGVILDRIPSVIDGHAGIYDVAFVKSRGWNDGSAAYPATGSLIPTWTVAISNAYGLDIDKQKGAGHGHAPPLLVAASNDINTVGAIVHGVGVGHMPLGFLTS
ncbi:MAG TPA: hypothetical protein VHD55_00410 [Candidatus Paceibacterota bacterium]|nr:hypothetical protein [Candidatus Paceibacterota bacterium]